MIVALWLLGIQGVIGAFDTIYYHEWRARLPARGKEAASELKLHAARDFFYAALFGTLPCIAWQGTWVLLLVGVFVAEIVLTLTDFVVEIEAGQLTVIGAAFAVVGWRWGRRAWYRRLVVMPASAAIACIAVCWTIQRIAW